MTPSTEKIPADFVPDDLTRRERLAAWFCQRGEGLWLRRVRWGRVAGTAALFAVAGYVCTAGAAYAVVRYGRGIEAVRFVDILVPSRWDNYRVARGEKQITDAKRYADEGKLMEAFLYARSGVVSAPGNRDGRLLLFDLLVAARRPDDARRTLLEGLRYHATDPVYVKAVLTILLKRQEDAHVVALARRYLPELAPGAESGRLYSLAAATACFYRGNYDQAEDFLRAFPRLAGSNDGRLLLAKIEWDRGYKDLALLQLRQLAAEAPGTAELHTELVTHLRQHGLMDEARRNSLAYQIAFPGLPGPRVELLYAYRRAGDGARVARETDELLRDFPADSAALLALADFAANVGDVALIRRITSQAASHGMALDTFAILTVETLVVARDFRGAIEAIRGYRVDFPDWEGSYGGLFDCLQAVALLGQGNADASSLLLSKFLAQASLRAESLLAVAGRLTELGAEDYARKTLMRAVEVDPLNQAALTRLVELETKRRADDGLAVHVQKLIRMRRPAVDVLQQGRIALGSDGFLYSREAAAALEAVRAALAQIHESRRP